MRSKKSFSTGKSTFVVFMTVLLASLVVPTQLQAQTFKVLHTFHGTNGGQPYGGLTRDTAGNLYGTTSIGGKGICGKYGCGTAFKLDKTGKQVWLHSFGGKNGTIPAAGLHRDAQGNLYGTALEGGLLKDCSSLGCGTVFKLNGSGVEQVLYRFTGHADGFFPEALLAEDAGGNLYGTTGLGGTPPANLGTVFRLAKTGKETVLYSFDGGPDGCSPDPGVILDAAGNLYGVTLQGGAAFCNSGYGTVFEVGATGKFTVIHTFGVGDGAYPASVLLLDSVGNLYGTTSAGGNSQACGTTGCGTIFELSPQGNGDWTATVLYSFCSLDNCADGREPGGGLVRDSAGNLYGTTYFGGVYRNCNGEACGVVFKLDSSGRETVLHSFTGGADGAGPEGDLVMDKAGNLYGTAFFGADKSGECAPDGCGVVFKLIP
jgi:uncharacterized repeat protein (TIGR03803 family)